MMPPLERHGVPASVAQAAAMLRDGRLTAVALLERCLAQAARHEATLHAFTCWMPDRAMQAARRADQAFAAGRDAGPLQGIPVAVKDMIDVAGVATTAQSAVNVDRIAASDAVVVRRLIDAGAVILGKTTTHEFAFGAPETTPVGPPARNPWNPAHFAGGSSSGSAVAVAAGMVLAAVGTDTAGSVRSPAALCGVAGYKPARAEIARTGVIALAPSLDSVGVLAMDSHDCALVMRACRDVPLNEPPAIAEGRIIGLVRHFHTEDAPASPDTIVAIDRAMSMLAGLGCRVRELRLPPLADWNAVGMTLLLREAYAAHEQGLAAYGHLYGRNFRQAVLLGAAIDSDDYQRAVALRHRLAADMDRVFADVDVIACAIQRGVAPRLDSVGSWSFIQQHSYGIVFNVSDHPALSVCTGFGACGLPLAMQLAGRRAEGGELLALGARYDEAAHHLRTRRVAP